MKNKKTAVFRKVPLEELIEVLSQVYEQGADYVDIVGMPDEEQDTIGIYVYPEYMNKEGEKEEESTTSFPTSLTDNDLENLI